MVVFEAILTSCTAALILHDRIVCQCWQTFTLMTEASLTSCTAACIVSDEKVFGAWQISSVNEFSLWLTSCAGVVILCEKDGSWALVDIHDELRGVYVHCTHGGGHVGISGSNVRSLCTCVCPCRICGGRLVGIPGP